MEQIKPNELRLGNYYEIDGAIYQVTTINSDGCTGSLIRKPTGVHTNGRRRVGIPLTEEVLRAAGFVKDQEQLLEPVATGYTLNIQVKGTNENVISAMCSHEPYRTPATAYARALINDHYASNNVYYLHQLQNLYFALTGTELEIAL